MELRSGKPDILTQRKMNKKMMKSGESPWKSINKHWQLYLLILLPVIYIFIFAYVPMYGATLAFKEYFANKGIMGSPWVGLDYFQRFLRTPSSLKIISNTVIISLFSLIVGMPFPILLAIALNEAKNKSIRKTVQMVTYAPYFISTVIMVTLILQWTDLRTGILNQVLAVFGFQAQDFMGKPEYFRSIFVWTGVWQFTGFNSIIYLAALSSVDQELYEAATVDGASKMQKIWLIDLPSIMPTLVILLILSTGQIMNVGFDKVYLMQNNLNTTVSEVISTYTYKVGLLELDFSYSTAIGLFNSVVNFFLITIVNFASKKIGETSLW